MRDHKSLLAWQEANAVARTVLRTTRGLRHPCIDQLQRAALSVQLNIAEGYAFRSSKRFRNHLDISYASAVETTELLELSAELELFPINRIDTVLRQSRRCQGLLLGLIKRLRKG
jgi:four helix bundle protein